MKVKLRAFILISLLAAPTLSAQSLLRVEEGRDSLRAEIFARTGQGGFRPGWGSSSEWRAGASASGRKSWKKTTFAGSFTFEQMWGSRMCNSMLVRPGYFPVDVLEMTPGKKNMQTYSFEGGLGADIGEHWILGGRISFSAANYTKTKDLRYTNFALDLTVEPTVAVRIPGGALQLGYIHRKVTESVDAEQVGSATDESYYAFLDKGMRYGSYEVWDGSGVHLNEAGVGLLPIVERSDGASLRFAGRSFQIGLHGLYTHGLVGEKGYNWFRFPGWTAALEASGKVKTPGFATLAWTAGAEAKADRLDEAVMDRQTEGGVTAPVIYAYNPVSDRLSIGVRAGCDLLAESWRLGAGLSWTGRWERSFLRYPFTDSMRYGFLGADIRGGASFGIVEFRLGAGAGLGISREKGLKALPGTRPDSGPFRLRGDWDARMEYLTAPRASLDGGIAVRIPRVDTLRIVLEGGWDHAFGIRILPGSDRFSAALRMVYVLSIPKNGD